MKLSGLVTRSENFGMTKGTEARNSSAWQETKNHLMLLKYEVQSSECQRNAGEVDKDSRVWLEAMRLAMNLFSNPG